jgi:xylan 1,4-beta-xylosidase
MIRWLIMALALVTSPAVAGDAIFSHFSYSGRDPVDTVIPVKRGQYRNPVLPGFHPDPSIVRVGVDYFLVNSSFAFYPGLPVFHSRDLTNWTQIGNAIDRPGMLDFTGLGVARAVFAPTIRYHDGVFYIINTCIECGFNFIISAKNPAGPWSDPLFLKPIDGIDPDLFFDDDGRAWITNNGPPVGTPLYDGHRAIWIQEFDLKAKTMIGQRDVIVNGGVQIADKPIWTEGPHIFKRDGWYYLIAAEGGTAGGHSETVFRSRLVTGPYVPGPVNPILTQRDLDHKRPFPVYATGHADFVQTPKGDWWAVFLGTRPYEANLTSMGRETFLLPVTWPKGGWPVILRKGKIVPQAMRRPSLPNAKSVTRYDWRDDFTAPALSPDWLMLRTPKEHWYQLAPHRLTVTVRPASLSGTGNPSFLAQRQRHSDATVTTAMRYAPDKVGDRAGLAVFADEQHHYFFGLSQTETGPMIVVMLRNGKDDPESGKVIAVTPYPVSPDVQLHLRVSTHGATLDFAYATGDGPEHSIVTNADGRMLASERSNQFTGVVIGLYAGR